MLPNQPREAAPWRSRAITTILLIMLAVMIIMDMFARRRGAHPLEVKAPAQRQTQIEV